VKPGRIQTAGNGAGLEGPREPASRVGKLTGPINRLMASMTVFLTRSKATRWSAMTFGKSIDPVSRGIQRQTLAQNCPRTVPGTKNGLAGRFSIRRKRELGFGRLQPRVLEKYRVTRTKLRKLQTNSTSPIGTWIPCEIVQTGLKNAIPLEHDPVYRLYSWIWNTVPDTRYFAFM